jgi:hypothetical protein
VPDDVERPVVVYFDANILRAARFDLKGRELLEIKAVADKHGVEMFVPELAFKEHVHYLEQQLHAALGKVRENAIAVGRFLDRQPLEVEDLPLNSETLATVKNVQRQRLEDSGISIIPTAAIPLEQLLDEAIAKVAPFQNSDRGFRDAVIVESIAAHASATWGECHILLVSNERWDAQVLDRCRKQSVRAILTNLAEGARDLVKAINRFAFAAWEERQRRALEFLRGYREMVEDHVRKARIELNPPPRSLSTGSFDYSEVLAIKEVRVLDIEHAFPGLRNAEALRAKQRYPMPFTVAVELDATVRRRNLGMYYPSERRVVSVADPSKVEVA